MLVLLIRLVAFYFLARFLLRLVNALLRPAARAAAPPQAARPRRTGDLVRDRVCNTFVARESALVAFVGGREEHFCSARCRDEAARGGARAASRA